MTTPGKQNPKNVMILHVGDRAGQLQLLEMFFRSIYRSRRARTIRMNPEWSAEAMEFYISRFKNGPVVIEEPPVDDLEQMSILFEILKQRQTNKLLFIICTARALPAFFDHIALRWQLTPQRS